MRLKRFCGIAYWRGAAIEALATTFRCETESRRRRELKLPKHCGTGFVFALLQPWHRQEQKLIFTSLAVACGFSWSCAYRVSLAGGCFPPFDFFVDVFFFSLVHLEENAGDVVQSMAGRILGRLLHSNGRGKEPRVFFHIKFFIFLTIALGIRVADLCTFLQNLHVHARTTL